MRTQRPLRDLLISAALLLPPVGCTIEIYNQEQEPAGCGNSRLDRGEQCEDGNTVSGDGCSSTCTIECGDGDIDVGEQCDTGGTSATCDPDCTFVQCGDGFTNGPAGEECDTAVNTTTCNATLCKLSVCGDGFWNSTAGEECDTAGASATCDADCTLPLCSDGVWNPAAGEQCDDGNLVGGDGCESDCTLTP
jgi:cysteine-rich repeat protein